MGRSFKEQITRKNSVSKNKKKTALKAYIQALVLYFCLYAK